MRVANFFDRNFAAIAQLIAGADPSAFRERLSKLVVALAFDRAAASTSEGVAAASLAADLLARFYPGLRLMPLDSDTATLVLAAGLAKAARAIHPGIDLEVKPSKVLLCLVVGDAAPTLDVPTLFMGSHGWTARFDRTGPVGCADSGNPFGASAAACIAVANAFRIVFEEDLPEARADERFELDVLNHRLEPSLAAPGLPDVDIRETHLVGLGAIGRAACWTLGRAPALRGDLQGVDPETIELSNLQRYVGASQRDQEKSRAKTDSAANMFACSGIAFAGHRMTWGDYLRHRGDTSLARVAVALDTPEDRIALQASLPFRIFNAWTQPGDLGISRHRFSGEACLACLYLPDKKAPSLSELVADALRLPEAEMKERLHLDIPVDRAFLRRVSESAGVPLQALLGFERESLRSFYSKAVCGTTYFGSPRGGDRGKMAVPMAFQSALAGVLLAVEIVADAADLRNSILRPVTTLNLLKPLGTVMTLPAAPHPSKRCLCQDKTYVDAYRRKYGSHELL